MHVPTASNWVSEQIVGVVEARVTGSPEDAVAVRVGSEVPNKTSGGLANVIPNFAVVFAIALWSSAALPLLNGFVGEFTILSGAFQANVIWAALASPGVVLAAAYLLWLYQRVMLGEVKNEANRHLRDLSLREWAVFLPLIALAFWIGLYPKPYFDVLAKPVQSIVERVQSK